MKVTWTTQGREGTLETEVDSALAQKLTHDSTELAASVARLLVIDPQQRPSLSSFPDGQGPVIEILNPQEVAGTFQIAVSKTERNGLLIIGTSATRAEPMIDAQKEEYFAALAAFTDPSDVESSYEMLGNRYGHEISGAQDEAEEQDVKALQDGYDNAILHDRGWPVRSKASGKIGFLADTTFFDGEPVPSQDRLEAFRRETGFVAQPVSRWAGKDVSFLVSFIPGHKLDHAPAVIEALNDLVRPAPALRA